jgi:membrane protease YdiL (CAAX protease family)
MGATDRFGIVRTPSSAALVPAQEAPVTAIAGGVSTLAPPTRWQPPGAVVPAPEPAGDLGSWNSTSVGATVIGAILLGGLMQLVFYLLGRNGHTEPEAFVRYAIVGTVAFYCAVAVIIIQRVHLQHVRLMWTQGPPLLNVGIGAGVGLALGAGMVAFSSAAAGHWATDSNAQLIASEGDIAHFLVLILITALAAPLVEETLFRGLFAESLRGKGTATAIWVSAVAFAFWHWPVLQANTIAFVVQTGYYTLMGAMLARLYWKGGLVRSMSAHAGFNGTLTVVAIALALSPGHVVHGNGFDITAPRGWHQQTQSTFTTTSGAVLLMGPSEASVLLMEQPTGGQRVSADTLMQRFEAGSLNALSSFGDSLGDPHETELPAGTAVEVHLNVQGHSGELVMLPTANEVLVIGFGSGGSAKADRDFQQMLKTLTLT